MRILYATSSTHVGGAERFLLRLSRGLRKLKPDWVLDAVNFGEEGPLEDEYTEAFETFHHHRVPRSDVPAMLAGLAADGKYDIVHAIDSFSLTAPAARLCPSVRFVQNVFPPIGRSPFSPRPEWLADPDLPYAALVTEFKANAARLPKLPNGEVLTIPNGVDTAFWTPDPKATRDIDVLWVGSLSGAKGLAKGGQTALDLIPLLCEKGLKYTIITNDDSGHLASGFVDAYHGFSYGCHVPQRSLRSLYRRSKIYVSTSTAEGMPATPLEAAACGCWPLVPRIDGLAEVFSEDWHSWYVPEQHPPATLADWLVGMAKSGGWCGWYGSGDPRIRETAERYSIEAMIQSYADLYRRISS